MKNIFKNWTWFEKILTLSSLLCIVILFIFTPEKNYLTLPVSVLGIVGIMLLAKGHVAGQYVFVIYSIIYAVLAYFTAYYGESIAYLFLMMPIHLAAIFSWHRNKSKAKKEEVAINTINRKEWIFLTLVSIALIVGFYFLLDAFNTAELIISTISLVSNLVAAYLMYRRWRFYAIGFVFNDVIVIVLWSLAVVSNGLSLLPTVLTFAVFLVNDVYALVSWIKRKQK